MSPFLARVRRLAWFLPFVALAVPAAASAPRAVLVDPVQDAGVVRRGESVPFTFQVRNEGDATLLIDDVQPACGCTVPQVPRRIEPGAAGAVEVVLETFALEGPLAKSVKVYTNDAANPVLLLTLKADVRRLVEARPDYLRFRHTLGEPAPTVAVTVWAPDRPRLAVEGVTSPYPYLRALAREAGADARLPDVAGRQWRLELTLAADAPLGGAAGEVVVRTDHPREPELRLPVSIHVQPVVEVIPTVLELGELPAGERRTWALEVRNHAADAVAVTGVQSDTPAVSATIAPVAGQDGRLWDLTVEVDTTGVTGEIAGALTLQTGSAAQPTVTVPVRGRVR
ncbi:MAG: DUF1573 domain-containing protein [Thermoanaerobaculia bacterium]